jgi:hypothetical protein
MNKKLPEHQNLDEVLNKFFSRYIRLRDSIKTTGTKEFCICVTCGKRRTFEQIAAGHCFGRSKAGTKYEESNVNAQCWPCNGDRKTHGRQYAHEMYIKMTYGEDELLRLRYLSQKLVIQRRDDWYRERIDYYRGKIAELEGK